MHKSCLCKGFRRKQNRKGRQWRNEYKSQLQIESNLSFVLYSREYKYISGYQKVNPNQFFKLQLKLFWALFWLLRRWYCELWICKEKFKFWPIAAAKLFYNALHSGTPRVEPNFESSNFKRTWHEVIRFESYSIKEVPTSLLTRYVQHFW